MLNKQNNTYQAMWVGVGSLSSFALAIASAAILSRYFDKTEYGTYRQILYVYNSLLIIFSAGLPKVFAYFLPRFSMEQGKDIVWKISKMLFLSGSVFSAFLFIFSGVIADILKNPELAKGLKYFAPIPMLLLPTMGIEGIFSTYRKTVFIAIYNTLTRVLMLLFIVLPVILFKGTYLYAIYGWIVVSIISFAIALYFKGIPFRNINREKSTLSLKEVFKYSTPLVVASLAGMAIRSADQFYISRYFGAEVFADYANGFIQIPLVGMVTKATSMVLMPQFSKMVHDKISIKKIAGLWRSALIKSAIIIYPMVIFFLFYAKPIVILLYSEKYLNSAIYFQIAMIVNIFNIIVFAPLLFSLGETKYYSKIQIFAAIMAWIGGYVVVSTAKKPEYIAILSVSITIFLVLINMVKISRLLNLTFRELVPLNSFFKIIIHSSIVGLLLFIVNHSIFKVQNNLIMLGLNLVAFVFIPPVDILFF